MKSVLLPLVAAVFVAATSFSAAAQSSGPASEQSVLPNLDLEIVQLVLEEAGAYAELKYSERDGEYLFVIYEGRKAKFYPTACNDTGCGGMRMLAFLNDETDPQTVNRFNVSYAAITAIDVGGGKVGLQRYLIADHGITRGTLVVNVSTFFHMIELWENFSKG